MTLILVPLFTFLAATSFVLFLFLFAAARPEFAESRIRKRLGAIRDGGSGSSRLLKSARLSEIPWLQRLLERWDPSRRLDLLLQRANSKATVGILLLSCGSGAALAVVVLTHLGMPVPITVLAAVMVASGPILWIRRRAYRRTRRFLEQMPDGLDTISQGLRAGLGLGQAEVFLAREAPDPIGTEFSILLQEMNLGLPVREAVEGLVRRVPLPEVRLFGTALLVQREVGGSLGELLTKLADVVRDRFRIEREIQTLTAQNRTAAWVVCSLPPALTALMFTINPVMMREVLADSVGRTMMLAALVSWLAGVFLFWRLLRIHV